MHTFRTVVAISVVLAIYQGPNLRADPIDPMQFASLGSFPSASGNYFVNTSGAPTIKRPDGSTITGVVYQDTPGHSLAVFVFDNINIVSGERVTEPCPSFSSRRGTRTSPEQWMSVPREAVSPVRGYKAPKGSGQGRPAADLS